MMLPWVLYDYDYLFDSSAYVKSLKKRNSRREGKGKEIDEEKNALIENENNGNGLD